MSWTTSSFSADGRQPLRHCGLVGDRTAQRSDRALILLPPKPRLRSIGLHHGWMGVGVCPLFREINASKISQKSQLICGIIVKRRLGMLFF